jgi:hypothetical protein
MKIRHQPVPEPPPLRRSAGLWTIKQRGGAKKRVNCRAKAIFLGTLGDANPVFFYQQMMVGRSDVNSSRLDFFAVNCIRRRKRAFFFENRGQNSASIGGQMPNDKYRRRQILWQPCDQFFESFKTTG